MMRRISHVAYDFDHFNPPPPDSSKPTPPAPDAIRKEEDERKRSEEKAASAGTKSAVPLLFAGILLGAGLGFGLFWWNSQKQSPSGGDEAGAASENSQPDAGGIVVAEPEPDDYWQKGVVRLQAAQELLAEESRPEARLQFQESHQMFSEIQRLWPGWRVQMVETRLRELERTIESLADDLEPQIPDPAAEPGPNSPNVAGEPSELYYNAYLLSQQAENLDDTEIAQVCLDRSLQLLQEIQTNWPTWKQNMVQFRRETVEEQMTRLNPGED